MLVCGAVDLDAKGLDAVANTIVDVEAGTEADVEEDTLGDETDTRVCFEVELDVEFVGFGLEVVEALYSFFLFRKNDGRRELQRLG